MFNSLRKIFNIFDKSLKKQMTFLFFLIIITMFVEMLSIGIIFPLFTLISDPAFFEEYSSISKFIIFFSPLKIFTTNQDFLNNSSINIISGSVTIFFLVYLTKSIYLILFNIFKNNFIYKFHLDLTKKFAKGYFQMPYKFFFSKNYSDITRNTVYEVTTIVAATDFFLILISEVLVLFGIIILIFYIDPLSALIGLVIFSSASLLFHLYTRKKLNYLGELRKDFEEKRLNYMNQLLGGLKEIKIYNVEDNFINNFVSTSEKVFKQNKWTNLISILPKIYLELLAVLIFAVIIVIFLLQDKSQTYIFSTLAVFGAACFRLLPSMNRILGSIQKIKYYNPAVSYLEKEYSLIQKFKKADQVNKFNFSSKLTLENVSFSYEGTGIKILDKINFNIQKSKTIGLIGESGSGKSTLANILVGLLDINEGKIIVDNKETTNSKIFLKSKIGYVPQNIFLTNETIKNNVAFGLDDKEIDKNKVLNSLKSAQLEKTILSLPEGIETKVGERGVKLSGGQLQRIGIARALYHQPEILVLDEPTSSLDTETEKNFIEVVKKLSTDNTIIIISHRKSILNFCDNIYNLEKGKLNKIQI